MKWFKKQTPEELAAKEEDDRGFREWFDSHRIIDTETGKFYASSKEMKADWPLKRRIKQRIKDTYEDYIWYPTNDLRWWFLYRFHPKHRYHVIRTGFKPGYYCSDTLMEAAIVKLFVEYIEIGKPFEVYDTETDECGPEYKAEWARIKELYNYFKEIDFDNPPWDDMTGFNWNATREETLARHERHKEAYEVFTNNLCDVIRLRHHCN